MSSTRHRRVAAIVSSALLGLMLIGTGAAVARPPGWAIKAVATPPKVVNGTDAGWVVTVSNGGKSNISAVYLVTDHAAGDPLALLAYVSEATWTGQTGPLNPCGADLDGRLFCSFGNIVSQGSVTFTVAFPTPAAGASWSFKFLGYGNGNTPSDGGDTSHGDFVYGDASINLTTDKNFDGEFTTDGTAISNDSDLGPKNIQFSSLLPPASNIGVSLEDGLANNAFSCGTVPGCANKFGEWTRLYAANGATFANGVKVVTTILGNKVPNGATVTNIVLIHVLDDVPNDVPDVGAVAYTISARCTGDGLNADGADPGTLGDECINVTKVGNNFQIVAWLLQNGGTRFGY